MSFELKLLPPIKLQRIDGETRTYQTPEGNEYPSVTSVLSKFGDKSGLMEWRKRIGEEEANKKTKHATSRGTRIHKLLEKYVLNEEIDFTTPSASGIPINIEMFNQVKDYLDKHVDIIYGSEHSMYSDKLQLAGTADLICRMHGVTAIVDFKTSTYHKKEEWVENYFLQAAAYAAMLYERHNMYAPNFCILIATEQDGLQFFWKNTNLHLKKLQDFLQNYK